MTRYAKPLGLTVLAMLLIAAVAAPSASALKEIRSAAAPRIITGAQTEANPWAFKVAAGIVKCTTANIEGTMTKTDQPSLTVKPTFSGCTDPLASVDVVTTGCNFVFEYEEVVIETFPGSTHTPGPMKIECEAGKQILLTPTVFGKAVCTIDIPAQTPTEPQVDHRVEGVPSDVLITYTAALIKYTVKGGGEVCGKEGAHADGFFVGSQTAKGYESKEGTKEGAQVAIWIN